MSNGNKGGAKLRERIDGLEAKVDSLLAELRAEREQRDGERDMAAKTIAELRAEMEARMAKANEDIAALIKAGGLGISKPRALSPDEVESIMADEPGRKLVALAGCRNLGLRPGDSFDPRTRFTSPMQARQFVQSGLQISAAPA